MDSNNEQDTQATPENDHEGRLAAENAKRRIQAKEAAQRADAAEAEAENLRQQIAELRLSQARQAVTAAHPELTAELIEKYAPENVDADSLADWADKSLGLVVALRGEKEPDESAMSDAEIELAEMRMELARQEAISTNEHVSAAVLDALCRENTPEGVAAWAAEFERIVGEMSVKPQKRELTPGERIVNQAANEAHGGGTWVGAKQSGLRGVASQLTRR